MKAILLAGGIGTRLRPITHTCPKPLLPIGNAPLIQRLVWYLRAQGVKEFVFLLYYQPEKFIDALGDGQREAAQFSYVIMEKDLSTAGSVKFAREHITETTLIYSADILADLPLAPMLDFHRCRRALVTLALYPVSAPLPFGLVLRERDGRIRRFFEKPTWPQVFSDWINAGIYLIEPELLDSIPDEPRPIFFEQEVFPPLAKANAAIFGFPLVNDARNGYWRDVGTPEDLRLANMDYLRGRFPPSLRQQLTSANLSESSWSGTIASLIGEGCEISPAAHVEACVIGRNCRIDAKARVRGSVLFNEVHIGAGAQVEDAIVMNNVKIEAQAEVRHHAVVAANAQIGAAAIVEANAIVSNNQYLAAATKALAKRALPVGYLRRFVDGGNLLGSIAGGMSTDFMRWVGKAFALRQQRANANAKVPASPLLLATEEAERFAVWTRALTQGILSAGTDVHLLETVTLPLARWILRNGQYTGGIYLGIDTLSGLLRLVFLHDTGEDFTTEESCSLERIELVEAPEAGRLNLSGAVHLEQSYLQMIITAISNGIDRELPMPFLPAPKSVLDREIPVRIGVIGSAMRKIVSTFFDQLGWPASIASYPSEMSTGFRRHLRRMQKTFSHSITNEVGIGFWIGGIGERLQMVLPGRGVLPFGQNDITIARLLATFVAQAQIFGGWLFSEMIGNRGLAGRQNQSAVQEYGGCMLPPSFIRAFRPQEFPDKPTSAIPSWRLGFDGRGAVVIYDDDAAAGACADALRALALLLGALSKTTPGELEKLIPPHVLGYRLLPCPDEAKAYLMRRLVEFYDSLDLEFSDGIRLKEKNHNTYAPDANWVVVRPCAGKQAIEIFWGEQGRSPSLSVSVRRRLALWLRQ
ncbi:MAG: sugar phosphate nucleotidyltransferase [candidate division KSB1 bacterium]|nr:sugar phosphate nucleotidyltransferase [candidate division KSB1 bacterium]